MDRDLLIRKQRTREGNTFTKIITHYSLRKTKSVSMRTLTRPADVLLSGSWEKMGMTVGNKQGNTVVLWIHRGCEYFFTLFTGNTTQLFGAALLFIIIFFKYSNQIIFKKKTTTITHKTSRFPTRILVRKIQITI